MLATFITDVCNDRFRYLSVSFQISVGFVLDITKYHNLYGAMLQCWFSIHLSVACGHFTCFFLLTQFATSSITKQAISATIKQNSAQNITTNFDRMLLQATEQRYIFPHFSTQQKSLFRIRKQTLLGQNLMGYEFRQMLIYSRMKNTLHNNEVCFKCYSF